MKLANVRIARPNSVAIRMPANAARSPCSALTSWRSSTCDRPYTPLHPLHPLKVGPLWDETIPADWYLAFPLKECADFFKLPCAAQFAAIL